MKDNNVLSIVFIYAASTMVGALIGIFIVCMIIGARDTKKKDTSFGVQGDLVAKAVDDVGPGTYNGHGDLERTDNLRIIRKAIYQVDSPWDLSREEYGVIKLYLRHVLDEIDPTHTPTR